MIFFIHRNRARIGRLYLSWGRKRNTFMHHMNILFWQLRWNWNSSAEYGNLKAYYGNPDHSVRS